MISQIGIESESEYCLECSKKTKEYFEDIMNNIEDYTINVYHKSYDIVKDLVYNNKKLKTYNLRNSKDYLINVIINCLTIIKNSNDFVNDSFKFKLCDSCNKKEHLDYCLCKCTIRNKYLKSYLVSSMFNYFIEPEIYNLLLEYLKNDNKFKEILISKLLEFKNETIISPEWKGCNYYIRKFTGLPGCFFRRDYYGNLLYTLDIPLEIYQRRKYIFLEDYICGHPLASHGWYKETLNEMESLGIF